MHQVDQAVVRTTDKLQQVAFHLDSKHRSRRVLLLAGTTVAASSTYEVGRGGASGDPPCASHTVIDDRTRSVNTYGFGGACDTGAFFNTSFGGRWIRFIGSGGTTMPTTALGNNRCGSYLAGWFNATMPTVDGIMSSGTVCFDTIIGSCIFSTVASVVKCGTFYVYLLPPVNVCNARYCTA